MSKTPSVHCALFQPNPRKSVSTKVERLSLTQAEVIDANGNIGHPSKQCSGMQDTGVIRRFY